MIRRMASRLCRAIPAGLLLLGLSFSVLGDPLDEITLESRNGKVVAVIHLTGPVHYLRHFPETHGTTLEIYYERIEDATNPQPWFDNESLSSPPSRLIPAFTVTTRDQAFRPKLVIQFARDVSFSVAPGADRRSFRITLTPQAPAARAAPLPSLPAVAPLPAPAPGKAMTPAEAEAAKINKQALALLIEGRNALAAGRNDEAIGALNALLLLPPNAYTQDGQELVGLAREQAGQFDRAKVEYELYLKLYPNTAGAVRVAQRLKGLAGKHAAAAEMAGPGQGQAPSVTTFGTLTSHYYRGNSNLSSTSNFNGVPTTNTLSLVDQSMLISSLSASTRYRTDTSDNRLVLRDVDMRNFLVNQPSQNLLYAAYGELKARDDTYLFRAGRQTSSGDGVLGRFDGVAAAYGAPTSLRVGATAGALTDNLLGAKPTFAGVSVGHGPVTIYGLDQKREGITDRRAVGSEVRYFDEGTSIYALVDYDTYFRTTNATQFMASTRGKAPTDNTYSLVLDHRRAPSLSIGDALIGAATTSVRDLLQTMSASELRDLARSRTAISNMVQVNVTHPLRKNWQVGTDLRVANVTGMSATGTTLLQGILPAIPGRGAERSVTAQLIGSSLYKQGDIWSGSITYGTGSDVRSDGLFLFSHTPLSSGWLMDVTLQMSNATDQFGGVTRQIMPMLRGTYRYSDRYTFDADLGYQRVKTSGPISTTDVRRTFGSAGLILDF